MDYNCAFYVNYKNLPYTYYEAFNQTAYNTNNFNYFAARKDGFNLGSFNVFGWMCAQVTYNGVSLSCYNDFYNGLPSGQVPIPLCP